MGEVERRKGRIAGYDERDGWEARVVWQGKGGREVKKAKTRESVSIYRGNKSQSVCRRHENLRRRHHASRPTEEKREDLELGIAGRERLLETTERDHRSDT